MIICFSGTGNSAAVARLLDKHLDHSRRIIWVTPVHAWGLPHVVTEAIGQWPGPFAGMKVIGTAAQDAPHWLVLTCGDDVGRAPAMWRNVLHKQGLEARSAYSVRMPNTYVNLPGFDVDSPAVEKGKLDAMPGRVQEIAKAIAAQKAGDDVVPGAFPAFKTKVLNPIFNALLMSPKCFRVNERCKRCGSCAKACPVGNITMTENGPVFGAKCTTCMACYHICPGKCISRPCTKGKGQYRFR